MTDTPALDKVVHHLVTHPHQLRIRKLLWVLCYQQWENDPQRLLQQDLHPLVQYLQAAFPQVEDIQANLSQIVRNLNKSAEYQQVADFILSQFQLLYQLSHQDPHLQADSPVWEEVAQAIAWHERGPQIQQLLIKLCRDYWEEDGNQLANISTHSLLQEAYHLAPTLEDLQGALIKAVETRGGAMAYIWAADALGELMWKVYASQATPETRQTTASEKLEEALDQTVPVSMSPSSPTSPPTVPLTFPRFEEGFPAPLTIPVVSQPPGLPPGLPPGVFQPVMPQPDTPQPDVSQSYVSQPDVSQPDVSQFYVSDSPAVISPHLENQVAASVQSVSGQGVSGQGVSRQGAVPQLDPFQLRLEIIKQVNPLRVKIVIFSLLYYPFDFSYQAWSDLRSHTLWSLLDRLCHQYSDLDTIQNHLFATARALPEPDQDLQVAEAIVRSLRRWGYAAQG